MRFQLNILHRFILLTVFSTILIALVQAVILSRSMVADMLKQEGRTNSVHVREVLRDKWGNTFPSSSEAFQAAYDEMSSHLGIFRIKVYNREGIIIWSDEPQLIGQKFPDNDGLNRALRGEVTVSLGVNKSEHRHETKLFSEDQLLESYIPIFKQDGGEVSGVVETYRIPHTLLASIDYHRGLIWGGAIFGAVLLTIALVWLFWSALRKESRLRDHLETARQFSEDVIENLTTGVVVLDPDLRVTKWNRKMEGLCEQSPKREEVLGKPLNHALGPEGIRALEPELRKAVSDGRPHSLQGQGWCFCRGGDSRTLNVSIIPVFDGRNKVDKVVLAVDDMTEVLNLQAQVMQSEKLASLGEISAGLAHEINNPLGIIVSKIKILLSDGQTNGYPSEVVRDLETIDRHASRISAIMRNLLTFIRRPSLEQTPIDLNWVVREALALVEKPFGKQGIQIEHDLAKDLPLITGDANQLQQVLLNILGNAKDAMPSGGSIRIHSYCSSTGSLVLEIADSGSGIPPENVERIFDPFFTTKEEGKGTGLGLSVSSGIVKAHGGEIRVKTAAGKGSIFELDFPALLRS